MGDAIAIAPELPFRTQALEFIQHLSRSLPNHTDAAVAREFLAQFDGQLKSDDASQTTPVDKRREAIKLMVAKLAELRGGLDGQKDSDAEASHLLLQYLLSTSFDTASDEYVSLVKQSVDEVKKAGQEAWTADRIVKHEIAARVLNNTYNYLPQSSPLRPYVLLALIQLLAFASDLSCLNITTPALTASLAQWSVSDAEKLAFVTSAAKVYASTNQARKALELLLVAAQQLAGGADVAEPAVVYAVADSKRFAVDDVLRAPGVQGKVSGKAADLAALFTGDALESVKKSEAFVSANGPWIEAFAIPQFTAEDIVRKVRLVALSTVAAQSATQELPYADVASALSISVEDVEEWVIDAIRENLLKARLSQPTSTVRVLSVSSVGSRTVDAAEWQLLERRLTEWKKAVNDVRTTITEAEALAAQGPITHRSGGGRGQGKKDKEERRQQQQQQSHEEEVAA